MSFTVLAANCHGEYLLCSVGKPMFWSFYFVLLTGHQLVDIHLVQVNCCYWESKKILSKPVLLGMWGGREYIYINITLISLWLLVLICHYESVLCYFGGYFTLKSQKRTIMSLKKHTDFILGVQSVTRTNHGLITYGLWILQPWLNGTNHSIPLGVPMIWKEPKQHISDYYFLFISCFWLHI